MNGTIASLTDAILGYLLFASSIAAISIPMALAIIKLARIRAAVHRHMVWLYTLVTITLLPAIWLYCPKLPLPVLPEKTERIDTNSFSPIAVYPTVESTQTTPEEPRLSPSMPTGSLPPIHYLPNTKMHFLHAREVLARFWFAGVVLMFIRLAFGWIRLHRICLAATALSQSELHGNNGTSRTRILLSSDIIGPACFGLLRPVIVLPKNMTEGTALAELQMILTHELAHIERRDQWINIFQRLIEAVFFFHPFIWYASFRLTQQREHICDNYVLARGIAATDYVEMLRRIVEWGRDQRRFQALALFEGRLLARVRSMLDPKRNRRTKSSGWAKIVCAAGILLCAVLATVRLDAKSSIGSGPFEEVTVNVTDVKGVPVAGAAVEALADYKPVAHGRTNEKGWAILKVPQESPVAWIIGLKAGMGFDYYENYSAAPFRASIELPEQVGLVLDGAHTIRIKAVDKSGKVLAKVPFVPWTVIKEGKLCHVNLSSSSTACVLTNRDGVAEFEWFPAHTTEQITLSNNGGIRPGTSFLVQGGEYYWPEYMKKPYQEYGPEVPATLLHATTISGRVLLPDGRGTAGITVRAEGRGNTPFFCRRTTRTATDGSFHLSVFPNQMYMVTVVDEKWAAETKSGIIVRENEPVENVNFGLIEGTLIHGRVVPDSNTAPAAGQTVFLSQIGPALPVEFLNNSDFGAYSKKQALIRTTKADEQGRYAFRAGPGEYMLGTRTMIGHNDGSAAVAIEIESQSEITHDLHSSLPAHLADLTRIGIAFAHQEKVYDGTMVFNACDYCHWPVNKPSKPRPAEPEK